ncbi:MAG TPA: peptide chain release factor N(5)-glutamine methyltransferase [Bacteroidales bacterium]|nr:peptide chain release factor N(5)-glutamine methyltransferase [Bacteroidales bacterium]
MAEKLQTISEIRRLLAGMFKGQWSPGEAGAMATVLIREYTAMDGAHQLAYGTQSVSPETVALIMSAGRRAASGEPIQYIIGYTLFCGQRIEVGPGVLIPRPETEEMTAMIIAENQGFDGTVMDLCTGSGCIAISVAAAFPGAEVYGTDNSETALTKAARNAASNNAAVKLFLADILTAPAASFPVSDIIISNPPYVRRSEMKLMRPNVLDHEPHEALFVSDDDPLIYYRSIASIASERLRMNGIMYLEINEALGSESAGLFLKSGFVSVTVTEDINSRKRFLKASKNG